MSAPPVSPPASPAPATSGPAEPDRAAPARRAPRVVTTVAAVGALAVLLGLLALVSPGVRGQLAVSLGRQDAAYVETYFVDPLFAAQCNPGRARFAAEVGVRSRLETAEEVSYVLRLVPRGQGRARTVEGAVATSPGQESVVRVAGRKPSRAYDAEVVFPASGQRLVIHCDGAAR